MGFLIGFFFIMIALMGLGIGLAKINTIAAWAAYAVGAVIQAIGILSFARNADALGMYIDMTVIWLVYGLIAIIAAGVIFARSPGKNKGNKADTVQPQPVQSDVNSAAASQIETGRPAQFDSGRAAAQPGRALIPETDDDFYEEKTVASFDDWTVPVEEEEDDEKTLPFFMTEKPKPKAILTRCADGQRIECTGEKFTVGKSPTSSDYKISDSQKISRQHATFYEKDGNYFIVDNSKNGTVINDVAIASGLQVPVKDGDRIRFADVDFIFNVE